MFLSPHKFPGGPQTPGVLIVRRELVRNSVPTVPGGGTVAFVDPVGHRYLDDPIAREEGGTPANVESIRAGLVFGLKQAVGTDLIQAREEGLWRGVLRRWADSPGIKILGSRQAARLSIVSFRIRHGGKYLHHNFVVALLNDLFGIQARGGCSCAGPYGHRLLAIGAAHSHALREEIGHGCDGVKPGWTRVNLNYFRRLAREWLAGLLAQSAGDGSGQRPGQHRQPGGTGGPHRGTRRRLVVRVAGDPGVIEDQHAIGMNSGRHPSGVSGQLARRDGPESAVRVIQQHYCGYAEFAAGLPQFLLPDAAQIGAVLVQGGRLAAGVAKDVHRRAARRHPVEYRAESERLIVGMRDDDKRPRPGWQHAGSPRRPRPGRCPPGPGQIPSGHLGHQRARIGTRSSGAARHAPTTPAASGTSPITARTRPPAPPRAAPVPISARPASARAARPAREFISWTILMIHLRLIPPWVSTLPVASAAWRLFPAAPATGTTRSQPGPAGQCRWPARGGTFGRGADRM